MTYEEIISKVQTCFIIDSDEFDLFIDDIGVAVEDLNLSITQREQLIGTLLNNIEGQPDPEFTSWSLIHFIEWLDEDNSTNYYEQLLHSLRQKPKFFTLLLANRIANGLLNSAGYRLVFLTEMNRIASDKSYDDYVRNKASGFYHYQINKGPVS